MKCPKCNYISFDYYTSCPKCKADISQEQQRLNLLTFKPEPMDFLETELDGQLEQRSHITLDIQTEQPTEPQPQESVLPQEEELLEVQEEEAEKIEEKGEEVG